MYQDESFDEYIKSILGYSYINPVRDKLRYPKMRSFGTNYAISYPEIERFYPEIYKLIYPMICKRCLEVSEPITKELLENITDEIFLAIETDRKVENNNNNKALKDLIKILLIRQILEESNYHIKRPSVFATDKYKNMGLYEEY